MDLPRLKTALVDRGHTRALRDGSVLPSTFAFDFVEVPTIVNAFRRMVRGLEFDISEMAITTYICAREHGKAFTALPIFPMRAFHHGAIVHNVRAGITGPKDLEGRQVGVNRGYTVTTGLWARGILQHEYGVDLGKVTWVLSGDEHVAEWRPPANVVPLAPGRTLEELLVAGEIPAAVGVQVDHPDIRPLIPDAKAAGFRAFRERGLYPINHTVVVRNELLEARPELAADIVRAFAAAKAQYLTHLASASATSGEDAFFKSVGEVIGDPLPYGIEPNRRMIQAVIDQALEQGILTRSTSVDALFPISA
jgi:4,5-dihydroxyphthalate decarboxylase